MSEETLAVVNELREAAAELLQDVIDLIDEIDGDPDFEIELEIGIEDLPHDQVDEGNDEPEDRLIA